MPPRAPPDTPLARRAEPVVRLDQPICLRCSKRIGQGGQFPGAACRKSEFSKCGYCAHLKKECVAVPEKFRHEVNSLLRLWGSLNDGDAQGERPDEEEMTEALRSYVKDVEAYMRKNAKHNLTHKPKGDEIQLLQVDAMHRIAGALEGILDVLRKKSGLPPLGEDDAPTDPGDPESERESEREDEGEGEREEGEGGGREEGGSGDEGGGQNPFGSFPPSGASGAGPSGSRRSGGGLFSSSPSAPVDSPSRAGPSGSRKRRASNAGAPTPKRGRPATRMSTRGKQPASNQGLE